MLHTLFAAALAASAAGSMMILPEPAVPPPATTRRTACEDRDRGLRRGGSPRVVRRRGHRRERDHDGDAAGPHRRHHIVARPAAGRSSPCRWSRCGDRRRRRGRRPPEGGPAEVWNRTGASASTLCACTWSSGTLPRPLCVSTRLDADSGSGRLGACCRGRRESARRRSSRRSAAPCRRHDGRRASSTRCWPTGRSVRSSTSRTSSGSMSPECSGRPSRGQRSSRRSAGGCASRASWTSS